MHEAASNMNADNKAPAKLSATEQTVARRLAAQHTNALIDPHHRRSKWNTGEGTKRHVRLDTDPHELWRFLPCPSQRRPDRVGVLPWQKPIVHRTARSKRNDARLHTGPKQLSRG